MEIAWIGSGLEMKFGLRHCKEHERGIRVPCGGDGEEKCGFAWVMGGLEDLLKRSVSELAC